MDKWVVRNKLQKEMIDAMIAFAEENWTAFNMRFEERAGHEIDETIFESLTDI